MTRTLSLVVSYDGTDFHGFQRLKAGRTVQSVLEQAWREVTGENVRTIGAGRTDAGVHALGQVVSFRTEAAIPADRVTPAMNGRLPPDLRVRRVREEPEEFHARFSATARTYHYVIRRAGKPSVIWDRFSLLDRSALDLEAMRAAGEWLLGSHDYRSFGTPSPGRTSIRRVESIRFRTWGHWLVIGLKANAFLQGMARSLTAQLLSVGRGDIPPEEVERRLQACDRGVAGKAAPPNGLYLARVSYKSWERIGNENLPRESGAALTERDL